MDFSDHVVLYFAQIIPLALVETLHAGLPLLRNNNNNHIFFNMSAGVPPLSPSASINNATAAAATAATTAATAAAVAAAGSSTAAFGASLNVSAEGLPRALCELSACCWWCLSPLLPDVSTQHAGNKVGVGRAVGGVGKELEGGLPEGEEGTEASVQVGCR